MIIYQHRRVVFGVNSSPFLLGATIEHHLEKATAADESQRERELFKKLKRSFYVDNCVTSVKSEEETVLLQKVVTSVMEKRHFTLRGLKSSNTIDQQENTPLLGIGRNKKEDFLFLISNFLDNLDEPITKRKILSIAHKIVEFENWMGEPCAKRGI